MKRRWLAISVLFTLAEAIWASAQVSTFSVKTEEVRVDVLVTDHGQPVTGLQAADFEVFDNGVRQAIESLISQQLPVSTILVFDMSSSLEGESLKNLRNAGSELLDGLKKGDQAALVVFGHALTLASPLTTDLQGIKAALDQVQPFGNTSLIDACYAGLMLAEKKSDRPLVIVFSDGLDTSSWLTSEAVLEAAKRVDAVVYAVSAGQLPDTEFLRALCTFTGGYLFEVESTRNLGTVFLRILEEFRQRYLLTYSPKAVAKNDWHTLKVRVKGRKLKIMARPGYLAGTVRAGADKGSQ